LIGVRDAWLLGAAVLLPLVALSIRQCSAPVPGRNLLAAVAAELPVPVPVLSGSVQLSDGSQLRVRIRPWRTDPHAQSSESAALYGRLPPDAGLDPAGSLHELLIERTAADPGSPALALEVSRPRIVDDQGACLVSLPSPSPLGNPFLTLAAAAEGPLSPGTSVRGLLWGSLPARGARALLPASVELTLP
jgi:hypothetical protein